MVSSDDTVVQGIADKLSPHTVHPPLKQADHQDVAKRLKHLAYSQQALKKLEQSVGVFAPVCWVSTVKSKQSLSVSLSEDHQVSALLMLLHPDDASDLVDHIAALLHHPRPCDIEKSLRKNVGLLDEHLQKLLSMFSQLPHTLTFLNEPTLVH